MHIKIFIGVLLVCTLAVGAWWFLLREKNGEPALTNPSASTATSSVVSLTKDIPAQNGFTATATVSQAHTEVRTLSKGQKEYRNNKYHISFIYPDTFSLKEIEEAGDAFSIVLGSLDGSQGMDVYIQPYGEDHITTQRFHLDEPSGVLEQPTAITIDNTPATIFFGHNTLLGDTREVWFIRDGYLYEVTTLKTLDAWLSELMATWQFI